MTEYESAMVKAQEKQASSVKFIAVVVGMFAVLSIIGYVILAVNIIHAGSVANSPVPAPTCQSRGGFDPTC